MIPMSKYYSLNNPTIQTQKANNVRLDIMRKQYGKLIRKPLNKPLGYGKV